MYSRSFSAPHPAALSNTVVDTSGSGQHVEMLLNCMVISGVRVSLRQLTFCRLQPSTYPLYTLREAYCDSGRACEAATVVSPVCDGAQFPSDEEQDDVNYNVLG